MSTRTEKDSMGEMEVPSDALYGASTARAVKNFPISGTGMSRRFIQAVGVLKGAAARANESLGSLDKTLTDAIVKASEEVAQGQWDDHFVVDVFQTGSGTSTNMNANEVIANRAGQILGKGMGSRAVHPNDHVNMGQSSNDTMPTAMQVSALLGLNSDLIPALQGLQTVLEQKSIDFADIVKTGRTHLQDATPITLGQVFKGFSGQIQRGIKRLEFAVSELSELPLGGTAVGTGVNTHRSFPGKTIALMSEQLGVKLVETDNHFCGQNNIDAMISASGCVRTVAASLYKIANDIRFMGCGPRAGLGELSLPAVQPGSSIMPGKVNPVMAEALLMVVAQVLGNDTTVLHGLYGSNFELNTMFPVTSRNLNESIDLLTNAVGAFTVDCLQGLQATTAGPDGVERGLMLGTALAPVVGYDKAAAIAKTAAGEGKTIREIALRDSELTEAQLQDLLDPISMTQPQS
ncbi:MAG: class II fumarate hydratase [Vulcanimicrobiota bacterium]